MYDTNSEVKTVRALSPQSDSGGTAVNGVVIDRLGFGSLVATVITGAITGTPTTTSMAVKLQAGTLADGSDMADVSGATATITAANTVAEIGINCNGLSRYVRITETTTFSGGTTPAVLAAATVTLGQTVLGPV